MNTFNAEQFMGTTTKDVHETKIITVPDGVYKGQITKLDFRTIAAKDTNPERIIMEVLWEILDSDGKLKKITGLEKNTVRQSIWLDMHEGKLEVGPGKNIGLGRLREAVGQNKPGKEWAPSHLNQQMATIQVKGQLNKMDNEIYAQVSRVSKL
jgi:hypothetical protein